MRQAAADGQWRHSQCFHGGHRNTKGGVELIQLPIGLAAWDDEAALSEAAAEFEPVADEVVEG